jgi:hypothetical protein
MFWLICIYSNQPNLEVIKDNLSILYPIFALFAIDIYTSLRAKIAIFREDLNETVDSFFIDKSIIQKPHKIYKSIILIINQSLKNKYIDEIFCFIILKGNKDRLVNVNGSKFIWNYIFTDYYFIEEIRDKKHLSNTPLIIDGNLFKKNLSILINIEENEYVFVLITKKNIPAYYMIIGLFRTVEPAFSKIAKILVSEKKLQEIKSELLQNLSIRSQYVHRANKTMHFIRNRLGPISNLIAVIDQFDKVKHNTRKEYSRLLKLEINRAKIDLTSITERANYLLDKRNNPVNFCNTEKCSLEKLYSILKRNYSIYFPENIITVTDTSDKQKKCLLINQEGFELFISDWLNNINKYKKEKISIEFLINNELLNIKFINDFSISLTQVNKMISDFMSTNRNEIMKRTTHGLFQIKSTLDEMDIPFSVKLSDNKDSVIFELQIKLFEENENSNF